jgi:2'-5' RNA ligase
VSEPPASPNELPARVRCFFALPLDGRALETLRKARDALQRRAESSRISVRFLDDEALHVTLCFIGSVAREVLPAFTRVLEQCAGVPSPPARFSAVDAFSSPKRAHVVIAELADPTGRLEELARSVSLSAEKLGVPLEERAFRPHVTLARLKQPADVRDWLEHAAIEPLEVPFREVRLYRSHPSPAGGQYSVLARAEFGTDNA